MESHQAQPYIQAFLQNNIVLGAQSCLKVLTIHNFRQIIQYKFSKILHFLILTQ